MLAKQMIYPLTCAPSPFYFIVFLDRVFVLLWPDSHCYLPLATSRVIEIIDMHYHTQQQFSFYSYSPHTHTKWLFRKWF
jgi:hypothetical protein